MEQTKQSNTERFNNAASGHFPSIQGVDAQIEKFMGALFVDFFYW